MVIVRIIIMIMCVCCLIYGADSTQLLPRLAIHGSASPTNPAAPADDEPHQPVPRLGGRGGQSPPGLHTAHGAVGAPPVLRRPRCAPSCVASGIFQGGAEGRPGRYTHIQKYTYICICVYIYIHLYIHTDMYMYMQIYVSIHIHTHTHVYIHTHTYLHINI